MAVQRWQAFTGKEATLEGDGRTFKAMLDERYDASKDGVRSYDVEGSAPCARRRRRLMARPLKLTDKPETIAQVHASAKSNARPKKLRQF